MMNPLLADLISDAKDRLGYSYESMSKACGGVPGAGRLHQLATKPLKTFPDPDTINGLARGCKVSPLDIIKASARSLGINVSDDDRDQVRIPGFDNLPPTVRDTFRDLGQQVGELANRAGDGNGKATPHTDAGGTPANENDQATEHPKTRFYYRDSNSGKYTLEFFHRATAEFRAAADSLGKKNLKESERESVHEELMNLAIKSEQIERELQLIANGQAPEGHDDGLGAFGGRARGDLDHTSTNDGSGENVRALRGPKPEASAAQDEGDEASIDEIMQHAAYEPATDNPDDK